MKKFNLLLIALFLCALPGVSYLRNHLVRQQIVAATIMISIRTPKWHQPTSTSDEPLPIPPDEYWQMGWVEGEFVSEGLGTLVAEGEEILLVTHDHWSRFGEQQGRVMFRDANGRPIGEIDLKHFKLHLRSRNGGRMILTAPEVLASAVSATLKSFQTNVLDEGDRVFLTQRSGGKVVISEAWLVVQSEKQGQPVIELQGMDGQVVAGGDSGGGVWLNGRLVATMWTMVLVESGGERRPTGRSVAAVVKAGG